MIRLGLISDLHLDFRKGGIFSKSLLENHSNLDVLCINGDTLEIQNLNQFDHLENVTYLFNGLSKNYKLIFVICGNHEFYDGEYFKTKEKYKNFLKKYSNVIFLDDDVFEYRGIVFLGTTLWTNFNNFDKDLMLASEYGMNDYNQITYKNPNSDNIHSENLKPEMTLGFHIKAIDFIEKELTLHSDKSCIVLSHHAPHFNSNSKYTGEYSGAYCSDLTDIILKHNNLLLWGHGHIHDPKFYEIGQCTIISNPRGYPKNTKEYLEYKPRVIELDI